MQRNPARSGTDELFTKPSRILREKNAYVNFFSIMLARGYQETFRKFSFPGISSYNAQQMEYGPSALIVHLRPPKYSNCGGCDQTNGGGTEKDLWQNFLS
jgi:hypothetical protein